MSKLKDPQQALRDCDTLMLDMDGTLLDLAFDNYMWTSLIPAAYARRNGMDEKTARTMLFAKFRSLEGRLDWYCLDHWSEFLGLDVAALHRDQNERIGYLPGARRFLETVAGHDMRVLMVTNSHRETLAIKTEVTGVAEFFDEIYTSHDVGHPKEDQPFWAALQAAEAFDPDTTLFIDDNLDVLRSAHSFGIGMLLQILRPARDEPAREASGFAAVDGVGSLLESD